MLGVFNPLNLLSIAILAISWGLNAPTQILNPLRQKSSLVTLKGSSNQIAIHSDCSANLEGLIGELLVDLPSYANRAIQRSRLAPQAYKPPNYIPPTIILAGRPEFEPIPLPTDLSIPDHTNQVFFTTLERHYRSGQPIDIEQFHWLFLSKTDRGWEFVLLFSKPNNSLPPTDSSRGEIAEAIRLWLRDCQAQPRNR